MTQVLTLAEIPSGTLCTTSGELNDTAPNAVADLCSVHADVVIGVPAEQMIASILFTITSLVHNAATCANEHNIVGQPGVGALLVGLARPNVGRLMIDHLSDITDVHIRRAAERAPLGTARGRYREEEDEEKEDIRPRNSRR